MPARSSSRTRRATAGRYQLKPLCGQLWEGHDFTLGSFTQTQWLTEGWFEWQPLSPGHVRLRDEKGQGHNAPFFVLRNEVCGEYFVGHLAWAANWLIDIYHTGEALDIQIGPETVSHSTVLQAGESITSPSVHLCHSSGSFDGRDPDDRDHLRTSVVAPHRLGRQSQYLLPADQGYYIPFDEASAFAAVDVAAEVGTELFVLDAGWWDVTPDWVPSETRFPRGLEPLIAYVHEKGMRFGLYVEPEAGRGNIHESKAFQAHPDWFGPKHVLDLAIPAAAAWMEAELRRLIELYELDLLRIDYNPAYTYEGATARFGNLTESNYSRYYEAFGTMFEAFGHDYPQLILQQAASGGARNDLATASTFHESYLTDGLSIPQELQVYAGTTLGLPPELLLIAHGADGGRNGQPQVLDTILRTTFTLTTPQIFASIAAPTLAELSSERREKFRRYCAFYREIVRPHLDTCQVYHHAPIDAARGVEDSPWFAMEFAAADRALCWALVVRMRNGMTHEYVYHYSDKSYWHDDAIRSRWAASQHREDRPGVHLRP